MWVIQLLLIFSVVVLYVWYYTLQPPINSPPYVVVNTIESNNIDVTQPLNTVDTVELGPSMTVALIAQNSETENGVYQWVAKDKPLQLVFQFNDKITRMTCLMGAVFANAQLLYVGPNKVFSMLATQSLNSIVPNQVTLPAVNVTQDLSVGNALVVERLLNGVDITNGIYNPYNSVAPAWSSVTETETQQLLTLSSTLTTANWDNLATTDQNVSTTSSPTFNALASNNIFGFIPSSVTTYTASDTFTWAANVKGLVVEVQAGGGGGGGSGNSTAGRRAGSGGSGSYVRLFLGVDDWGVSYTGLSFVVGAGGTGGAAGNNSGTDGSNSTLNWVGSGNPLIATTFAGQGGNGAESSRGRGGAGGAIPTIVGGYSNYTMLGTPGTNGNNAGSFQNPGGNNGGNSPFGRGGRGATEISNSVVGEFGAGGGAGARDNSFNRGGANGGDGFVRITAYI